MALERKNIFKDIDLSQINSTFVELFRDAIETYWEQDIEINLQAINDFREIREEILVKNVDFFTSQIKVERHKPISIRLSNNFVNSFFSLVLGDTSEPFKLTKLSELEIKILNNFCEFLYKKISASLIPVETVKITENSDKNINFFFNIKNKSQNTGMIAFSIPQDRISFPKIEHKDNFSDDDFNSSKTSVRIKAGSSKIAYSELKNLAIDDIVLLEESNISKLILISGELEKSFNVKVDSSLIFDVDSDEDENQYENNTINNEVMMEKNLWDDIQIEINAEFEKVKMTISELKQITQGQVVDLGSVFNNEISLFVENKKIASGELIIINDRYAVKLNKVMSSNTKTVAGAPQASKGIQKNQPPLQTKKPIPTKPIPTKPAQKPPIKQTQENEEFDYSDFEK